jgi:CBS domain-containing membrane protein
MTMSVTAKEILTEKFNSVKETDTLSRCIESFKKGLPPVLAVLDEKGKYAGMITRKSIFRSRLNPAVTKVKSLMQSAPTVAPNTSLGALARLMIGSGIRQLPLVEKNKILGFVTDDNVIHAAAGGEWGKATVDTVMTRAPHMIEANRSVGAVLGMMREFEVSHVPVVEGGKLLGLVSFEDILESIYWPQKRQTLGDIVGEKIETLGLPVKGIMSRHVATVNPKENLHVAEQKMHDRNVSCLVVVDADRLVGIVTRLDFLELISQMEAQADRKFTLSFGSKGVDVDAQQQSFMMEDFDGFLRKFEEAFGQGTLFVYLKSHGNNNVRDIQLVHCRLQFRTVKGTFFSASEGWGVEPTFRVALDRLERRLLRSKELLAYNPKYARDYMRKIGLPSEEQ